jgi:hypothetical protein
MHGIGHLNAMSNIIDFGKLGSDPDARIAILQKLPIECPIELCNSIKMYAFFADIV